MSYESSLDFDHARMYNPWHTEEHEEWRNGLRRFFDKEVIPYAESWDENHHIPDEMWVKAAAVGILGVGFPEQYGGISESIDIWHKNILNEELARVGVGGFSASLMVHNIGLPPVVNFASEEVKQLVIPQVLQGTKNISLGITEFNAGSDVANLITTARKEDGFYIVNGSKTYITGGMRADWVTTAVRTGGAGASGVSVLLIPTDVEGFSRTVLDKKQGWWSSDTATLYFDNVKVPMGNLLGQENSGFKVIMRNFNNERMAMSAAMEAFSRVCLAEAVEWAQQRHTFGARLADHQVIRHKIMEMKRHINASQSYLMTVSKQIDDGHEGAGDIALLKVQCSQTMEFCAREAMQILGGAGYMRGSKVERIYREVRVNAIGGGSEEIMRDLAARQYGV